MCTNKHDYTMTQWLEYNDNTFFLFQSLICEGRFNFAIFSLSRLMIYVYTTLYYRYSYTRKRLSYIFFKTLKT